VCIFSEINKKFTPAAKSFLSLHSLSPFLILKHLFGTLSSVQCVHLDGIQASRASALVPAGI
jgi:hypothetical protein